MEIDIPGFGWYNGYVVYLPKITGRIDTLFSDDILPACESDEKISLKTCTKEVITSVHCRCVYS